MLLSFGGRAILTRTETADRMIHPATTLRHISDRIGLGVVAIRRIPRGTIVWTLDALDHVFTPGEAASLPAPYREILDTYAYTAPDGNRVLCWDFGRFINHSCRPTSRSLGPEVEIAVRDIEPGDQITSDYGELNLDAELECHCGAEGCRGSIRRDDVLRLHDDWDRELRDALPSAAGVDQPLRPFLEDPARFDAWVAGDLPIPSSRNSYVPATGASAP